MVRFPVCKRDAQKIYPRSSNGPATNDHHLHGKMDPIALSKAIKAILDSLIIGEQVLAVEEKDPKNRMIVKCFVAKDVSYDTLNGDQ
jgi:hypothetical protein